MAGSDDKPKVLRTAGIFGATSIGVGTDFNPRITAASNPMIHFLSSIVEKASLPQSSPPLSIDPLSFPLLNPSIQIPHLLLNKFSLPD